MEALFGAAELRGRVVCVSLCGDCVDYRSWPHHALFGHWNRAEYCDGALADVVAPLSDLSALAGVEHDLDTFSHDLVGRSRTFGRMPILFAITAR